MTNLASHPEALTAALARWEASEHPVISCFVNWSVTGRGLHEGATVVRKELHEAASEIPTRGAARESFDADAARIERFLADDADPAARGIAIFACDARGLWQVALLGVPIETEVHVGEHPQLLPLVEATQDAGRTLIALADSEHLRLISLDLGGSHEDPGIHRIHPETSRHSAAGGWSQSRFQRARDTVVERFAGDAANAIADAAEQEHIEHIIIGGDEVIARPLLDALPTRIRARIDAVEHLDIQAPLDQVAERIWPEARAFSEAQRHDRVRTLAGHAGGGVEATTQPDEVQTLLSAGRIDTLAFDPASVEPAATELLLREAFTHGSRVLVARGDAALAEIGGLAASLR